MHEYNSFNPRTHVRCDLKALLLRHLLLRFNPRTHVRCDIDYMTNYNKTYGFNPRTHVRCDIKQLQVGYDKLVSTHAPT